MKQSPNYDVEFQNKIETLYESRLNAENSEEVFEISSKIDSLSKERIKPYETKRDKIVFLLSNLPSYTDYQIAEIVGCTKEYVSQFTVKRDEYGVAKYIYYKEPVPEELREEILTRDEFCVKCGGVSELEIHHIIPEILGGPTHELNLAVLCSDCHNDVHRESGGKYVVYSSLFEFASICGWEPF